MKRQRTRKRTRVNVKFREWHRDVDGICYNPQSLKRLLNNMYVNDRNSRSIYNLDVMDKFKLAYKNYLISVKQFTYYYTF